MWLEEWAPQGHSAPLGFVSPVSPLGRNCGRERRGCVRWLKRYFLLHKTGLLFPVGPGGGQTPASRETPSSRRCGHEDARLSALRMKPHQGPEQALMETKQD